MIPVALIGRERELALLAGLVRRAAHGRGGSVLIEGEPGIGKSALVREAAAGALEAGCEVFWGAGDELSQELPLLPFLDGLRVREASASSRRNVIVRLLRGEDIADRADVPAVLAEQLLALVAEQCSARPALSTSPTLSCVRATRTSSRARCRGEISGEASAWSSIAKDSWTEPARIRH